ncbi:Tetratricopeptide-like helical [Penicillium taxi]|uniref:Tetratricopeptide-like helical n=1 Tax=Penicillium taxi TaxID=168475 RepID=UPI0025450094|nr:Tetratricopeptide-like helical [Penicillium taxi]KAJ5893273.1 Tetratricopeptide-like helical [Penicillium taxi]
MSNSRFPQLLEDRDLKTTEIYNDPHNPSLYLDRARIYDSLGFFDLVAADAYRALSLLESVIEPDACEYHAKKKVHSVAGDNVNPSHVECDKNEDDDDDDDEDEDDGTVPVTKEEYDALIMNVYTMLVRGLYQAHCYRDAYEFGMRGLKVLREYAPESEETTTAKKLLDKEMDPLREIYTKLSKSETPLESMDPTLFPAQGRARRIVYPWNEHEPDRSSPEELNYLNERLSEIAPKCEVRVTYLPRLYQGFDSTSVQLGLYAKEDIAPNEIILRETSLLTATNRLHDDLCDACHAPLPDLSAAEPPVRCEGDCDDTIFCSQKCHDNAQEVYHGATCGLEEGLDSIGKDIPDPKDKADYLYLLLLGRALAMSATQDVHVLDLPEVKYIWGDFRPFDIETASEKDQPANFLPFSFQLNIMQPMRILDEMEIDPYTSLHLYDTWVLNTLYAKFRGTASGRLSTWDGGPELCAVHPLWCLANHSCDPNVCWEWGSEITFRARSNEETAVWVRKDEAGVPEMVDPKPGGIKKDEEIMNHYCDIGLPVNERREWASGALGGGCTCKRCMWEMKAVST